MNISLIIFTIFTWVPVIALTEFLLFTGIGMFFKIKNKPCKHFFVAAVIAISIFVAHILMLIIIGMAGIGPPA